MSLLYVICVQSYSKYLKWKNSSTIINQQITKAPAYISKPWHLALVTVGVTTPNCHSYDL